MHRGWLGAAMFVLAACSSSAQPAVVQTPETVVGAVGSRSITLAELDAIALQQSAAAFGNATLAQAMYDARRRTLEELIGDELIALEAKGQGVQPAALVKREVESKLNKLRQVLNEQRIFSDPRMKLLVFTEHKDTLDYLAGDGRDGRPLGKLREWGLSVTQIHGGMPIGDLALGLVQTAMNIGSTYATVATLNRGDSKIQERRRRCG